MYSGRKLKHGSRFNISPLRIFKQKYISFWSIPIGLILLNFVLKIIFLGQQDIAMDEPFTIYYSQAGFASLFEMLKTENNPPLFFILMHFWIKVFGISAFSVRFLPLVFSTMTAPITYLIGKRFFSNQAGVIASLIFTFSNYQLAFSHEARVYPLFALLTSLSMFFFFSMIQNPVKRNSLCMLIIVNVLLIYSHFFGFYVIVIQTLSCLIFSNIGKVRKPYFISLIITLSFYLPYFPILLSRFYASSGGTWVPTPLVSDLYTMVWRFSNVPVVTVFFLLLFLATLLKYIIKRQQVSEDISSCQKVLLSWFFIPYFVIFLISFKLPMFFDRYLVFISIAYYLLIGQAIVYLSGSKKVIFYILSFIGVGGMLLTFHPNQENHRRLKQAVEVVKSLKDTRTAVFICPEWLDLGFAYYYNQKYFKDYGNLRSDLSKMAILPVNHPDQVSDSILKKYDSIILFEEWPEVVDKNKGLLKEISGKYSEPKIFKVPEAYEIYYFYPKK